MSAAARLIAEFEAAGGSIQATGDKLKLSAPQKPPDLVLRELENHKPEILAHLARPIIWGDALTVWISWFMEAEPPMEPFELHKAVMVARPALFWKALKGDVLAGPAGPRAQTGAMQADIKRLFELFGPKVVK